MSFQPLIRMQQRLDSTRADCDDTTLFFELLYLGELTLKLIVAGMVAAVDDDRDRHRYRLEHTLVRASGIGDWSSALDDLLTGPAAATLSASARVESAELTKSFDLRKDSGWQVEAIQQLQTACRVLDREYYADITKVSGRVWARHFAWLRNKTRGHGAPTGTSCGLMAAALEQSIHAVTEGFALFDRDWAYLHRNLSGKYRVIPIGDGAPSLEDLKRSNDASLTDGVHVVFDIPRPVRLLLSDVELSDFFLCNGNYNDNTFEALSYVTDQRKHVDATPFRLPPTALPESETQGQGTLEPQGGMFGNLPPRRADYVARPQLEEELSQVLLNDRHAVITLVGRGGVGKTSLALEVLHNLASGPLAERYFAALWFSARDVDLTALGPKLVRPRVVSIEDVAQQFTELTCPKGAGKKGFKKVEHFADQLGSSDVDPMLFVFDNFETVRDPQAMYEWLDLYVRPPNKILITTRLRDFKGDWPVEVSGMRRGEFDALVDQTAGRLGVAKLVTSSLRASLFDEADGHPYVAKLLLGDLANLGKPANLAQLVANKDDVLQALFERTFNQITPLARRLFLTLCGWRSAVPRLAVEAALLRVAEEALDTGKAVDQLIRSSMVDATRTPEGDEFLTVPLAAALFGQKKLKVSPLQSAIKTDLEFLHMFGAAGEADVAKGLGPRLGRLVRALSEKAQADPEVLRVNQPVLEHIARQYSPAWLLLADLYEEQQTAEWYGQAAEAVRHYLEERPEDVGAWSRLVWLARRQGDPVSEAHALASRSAQTGAAFEGISEAAYRLNALQKDGQLSGMADDERITLFRTVLDILDGYSAADITATDYSRMAWLAVNSKDEERAARYVLLGRERDETNVHIKRLAWLLTR